MTETGGAGNFSAFIPLILMFLIFYFLLIRPQQKKQKEHQEMLKSLKKGDKIITSGGIYGRIIAEDEAILIIEIADNVKIRINRSYVADKTDKADRSDKTKIKIDKSKIDKTDKTANKES